MSASKRFKTDKRQQYLPDPSEILSAEKEISRELDKCVENLRSIDLFSSKAPHNIKEDHAMLWIFSKFGVSNVLRIVSAHSSLPKEGVTGTCRVDAIRAFMSNTGSETHFREVELSLIIQVLENCPRFLSSFESDRQASHHSCLICPPTSTCYQCHDPLTKYHECNVRVYSTTGLQHAKKCTLRCVKCSLLYNYSMYGNKHDRGFHFYSESRDLVEVSDTLYFERGLLEFQCSLA